MALPNKTSDYLSPFKILIADPNPLMRRVTRGILQILGARKIIDIGDINQAASFVEQGDIDIVLSERYLTGACGVDFVRWIRQTRSDVRFTPFIMVTSQIHMPSIITARTSGINEFVAKPFSANSLTARLREVVERPRPFVNIGRYFGPDRRRKFLPLEEKSNRRHDGAPLLEGNPLRI